MGFPVGFSVICGGGFSHHGERLVAAVAGRPATDAGEVTQSRDRRQAICGLGTTERQCSELFAQILGKLYFFNLRENLRLILFDYEEKRSRTTNGPFKSAC
jgi:hypothetical protein